MIKNEHPVSKLSYAGPSNLIAYGIVSFEYLSLRGMTTVVALHVRLKVW